MSPQLQHYLDSLSEPATRALLGQINRGIEKESLRITPDGRLAQTPHPAALGSALTHPSITTDYSEALLEFIEHCENLAECFLVGDLRGGEARAVNAIVQARIDAVVERLDVLHHHLHGGRIRDEPVHERVKHEGVVGTGRKAQAQHRLLVPWPPRHASGGQCAKPLRAAVGPLRGPPIEPAPETP